MMGGYIVFTLLFLLVNGVFGAETYEEKQVLEGDSVTLHTGVTKQQHDKMLWYFNNTLIALINEESSESCLYDGEDGRFRDKLKADFKTGSLTITSITTEHAGRYEAELIRGEILGETSSLNRNSKCDSTKIIPKTSSTHDDTIKTFSVSVTVADKTNKARQVAPNDMSSGLSAGAVKGVVVAVLLLQLLV